VGRSGRIVTGREAPLQSEMGRIERLGPEKALQTCSDARLTALVPELPFGNASKEAPIGNQARMSDEGRFARSAPASTYRIAASEPRARPAKLAVSRVMIPNAGEPEAQQRPANMETARVENETRQGVMIGDLDCVKVRSQWTFARTDHSFFKVPCMVGSISATIRP
jgi:hypothetical protein